MPNDNATLKSLIAEAVDACRVKIVSLDETDPRVAEAAKKLEKTFAKFQLDNLYAQPIPYDEPLLLQHILLLRTSTDGSVDEFVAEAKKLSELLEEIAKEPIKWLSENGGTAWNNQMLDALRKLRSTVTRKKNALANAGSDPMNVPGFPALDEEFNTNIDIYRTKLKDNSVQANGDDVKLSGQLEQLINMAVNAAKFIQYFKMAIKFIKEKIGA
jgi:hypothetical protein